VSFLVFATFVRCPSGRTNGMSISSTLRLKRFIDSLSRTSSICLNLFKTSCCCLQDLLLTLGRNLSQTEYTCGAMQPKLNSMVAILGQSKVEVLDWLVLLVDQILRGEAIENVVGSTFLARSFATICAAGQGIGKGTIQGLDCDSPWSRAS
jgi:hypothetical protein